jgi:hypothetical protein
LRIFYTRGWGSQKMKAKFLTELHMSLKPSGEGIWVLDEELLYYSVILKQRVGVPRGFETDLSSVPRLPFLYWFWGAKAHREGVLHDYFYRKDSLPVVKFSVANKLFLEAMVSRGKPFYVRHPMYAGVVVGGWPSYHKKLVNASL